MALDSGIAKMGVLAFIFLIAFVGLLGLIPNDFAVVSKTYASTEEKVPDSWEGMTLVGYNFSETYNNTLSWAGFSFSFDIGGRNMVLEDTGAITHGVRLAHAYGVGLLGREYMDWYNQAKELIPTQISAEQLDDDFTAFDSLLYEVVCKGEAGGVGFGFSTYFKVTAIFSFNTTLYALPSDAYFNNALDILIGINPENSNLGMDIWFLITSLLTFNTIEVFGSSGTEVLILNGIIAACFFAPIIIFALAVAVEVLPDWL